MAAFFFHFHFLFLPPLHPLMTAATQHRGHVTILAVAQVAPCGALGTERSGPGRPAALARLVAPASSLHPFVIRLSNAHQQPPIALEPHSIEHFGRGFVVGYFSERSRLLDAIFCAHSTGRLSHPRLPDGGARNSGTSHGIQAMRLPANGHLRRRFGRCGRQGKSTVAVGTGAKRGAVGPGRSPLQVLFRPRKWGIQGWDADSMPYFSDIILPF